MITTDVITRVFFVQIAGQQGTAFTSEVDGRQYLITARHLLDRWNGNLELQIFHDNKWKPMEVAVVGVGAGEVDIAVLAAQVQLAPSFPMELSMGDMVLGQQIYFLGFPLGMVAGSGALNRNFPFPLVKCGWLSAAVFDPVKALWIDGHNNPGFSGGPVIFVPGGQRPNAQSPYKIAGIVSGYRYSQIEVYDKAGHPMGWLPDNSGIMYAFSSSYAVELIESNPIGVKV